MKSKESRRYEARMSFYTHLFIFAILNSVFVGINLMFSPKVLWVVFLLLGWGSGLFIHGLAVFWGLEPDEASTKSLKTKGRRAVPV